MKNIILLLFVLFTALASNAQNISGTRYGDFSTSSISVKIDCRSFGQTVQEGGNLNIKYADGIMCWATRTTVLGVQINEAGWVPEVFIHWDWDDSSLGTTNVAGANFSLGESVGIVAAHSYVPSTYNESCNGGTNSFHIITATVSAMIGGTRQSNSAVVTICVENPDVTWAGASTWCYGDDADCTNDPGASGTWTNGGNGTAIADQIIRKCETAGASLRIKLKGGVTFSTTAGDLNVGGRSCLIESYGTGRAKIRSTSVGGTFIQAHNLTCAGYRLHNLQLAGSGNELRVISGNGNTGCYILLDITYSQTAGEEFKTLTVIDPPGNVLQTEAYYIKNELNVLQQATDKTIYIRGRYTAFVGGEISGGDPNVQGHNVRLPQWDHVVFDAVKWGDHSRAAAMLTLRQDCGNGAEPNCSSSYPDARIIAITRNYFLGDTPSPLASGSDIIELLNDGVGGLTEPIKTYDVDIIWNLFAKLNSDSGPAAPIKVDFGCNCGEDFERIRIIGNAADTISFNTGNFRIMESRSFMDKIYIAGNVMSGPGNTNAVSIYTGSPPEFVHYNNVCYENGTGSCDQFTASPEDITDVSFVADPFNVDGVQPGTLTNFSWDDLLIDTGSPLRNTGKQGPYTEDVGGNSVCQGTCESGVYEVN